MEEMAPLPATAAPPSCLPLSLPACPQLGSLSHTSPRLETEVMGRKRPLGTEQGEGLGRLTAWGGR